MTERYFDAVNGDDANTGTFESPWQTIAKCSSLLNGDVALFKGGDTFEYNQDTSYILANKTGVTYKSFGVGLAKLKVSQQITPGDWSVYSGTTYVCDFVHSLSKSCWLDTTTPLIIGSGKDSLTAGQYYGDTINNKLYVRLPDDDNPADHTIDYGVQRYAFYATGADTIVESLEIYHGEVAGILADSTTMIVRNNFVHHCIVSGIDAQNVDQIYGNTIEDIHSGKAYPSGQGYGITVKNPNQTIYSNTISRCYENLLVSAPAENTVIHHNILMDAFVNVLDVGNSANTVGNELKIYNNLCVVNPDPTFGTAGHGIAMQGGASGVIWKNNISIITYQTGLASDPNCYSINGSGGQDWSITGRNFQFDNNLGYAIYGKGDYGNILSITKTFAQWKSESITNGATGADANAIENDPLLDTDYKLLSGSPCIGAAVDVGLTEDAEGNQLYSPYNIGPYGAAAGELTGAALQYPGRAKYNPSIISGTGFSDWVFTMPQAPELIAWDDGTLFGAGPTYTPIQIDLGTFVDTLRVRFGSRAGVIYNADQSAENITKIDKVIDN